MVSTAARITKNPHDAEHTYAKIDTVLDVPNLIQVQIDSFEWFKSVG